MMRRWLLLWCWCRGSAGGDDWLGGWCWCCSCVMLVTVYAHIVIPVR